LIRSAWLIEVSVASVKVVYEAERVILA
jgi:hypothetical protein